MMEKSFRVGDWNVDPSSGRLCGNDDEVKLEPKVMEVLACLASHQGKVVSRETLEATVWAGTIVGYDAISGTIIKLRKALGDNSRNPRYIETVSKRGYRLIADVIQDSTPDLKGRETPSQSKINKMALPLAAAVALIVIILTQVYQSPEGVVSISKYADVKQEPANKTAKTKPPTIIVLPLKNLSNDPQQEYFSDGITDDLITGLSRVASLRVIARQSAYYFKNSEASLSDIASELDVDYGVEGSVQKAGKLIRINVRLTDINSGQNIWAGHFDGKAAEVFDIQDRVTSQMIEAMFVTLSNQEKQDIVFRTTSNFEAYDAFLLGQQYFRDRSKEGFEQSRDAYRRAIELDPAYARAYGALAVTLINASRNQWTSQTMEEARDRSIALASKAVSLNNGSPQAHWSLGFVHVFRKEFEQAEAAARKTVELSPNYADGYGLLAFIANWRGKAQAAERHIKKAITLNPYHTFDYPWNLGLSYYTLGRHEESIVVLQDALERNETAMFPRLFLAANYVRLGQQDDAEWEVEQVVTQRPATTLSLLSNTVPYEKQQMLNSFLVDLKKAGMPE